MTDNPPTAQQLLSNYDFHIDGTKHLGLAGATTVALIAISDQLHTLIQQNPNYRDVGTP